MHNDVFLTALGKRIKQLRSGKKIDQQTLASLCDFEKSNMSRIENGNTNPTILTMLKISKALNVSVSELMNHEGLNDGQSDGHDGLSKEDVPLHSPSQDGPDHHHKESALDIGTKVKGLRADNHLTQGQLAAMCGCEEKDIHDIEDGKYNSAIMTIKKISSVLGISLKDLFA